MIDPRLSTIADAHPHPLLFATVSGAHLYGFPSPDSDWDLRGAHILPVHAVLGLDEPEETMERFEHTDGMELDLVTHDVRKFFRMLLKPNGYVLEQVLSPLVVRAMPEHAELCDIARRSVTRRHAHHYLGFATGQKRLFDKDENRRIKPLLYIYRVLLTGIHLMQTGRLEANLVHLNEEFKLPWLPELIERKVQGPEKGLLNAADLTFHEAEYARLLAMLETSRDASTLPDNQTIKPELESLLLRLRGTPQPQ